MKFRLGKPIKNAADAVPESLSGCVYHHPIGIAGKLGAKYGENLFFRQRLATSRTDKQQHVDGKPDGKFSPEKRLSFANQLHEKLVHNRVGVTCNDEQYLATSGKYRKPSSRRRKLATGIVWQSREMISNDRMMVHGL